MRSAKRLFALILVNTLVAAITTVAVLKYWEKLPKQAAQETVVVTVLVTVPAPSGFQVSAQPEPILANITPVPNASAPLQATAQPQAYQVQPGDTLSTIAILFKVGMDDILRFNNLDDPDSLYAGQMLLIPASPLPTYTPDFTSTPYPTATSTPQNTHTPIPTPTRDVSPARLAIESVLGTNVLDIERVKIIHTGGGEAALADWRLTDEDGNSYKFPALYLYAKGSVTVNTKAGLDTVMDLYWGLSFPVWRSGEKATLHDEKNNIRAEFIVP